MEWWRDQEKAYEGSKLDEYLPTELLALSDEHAGRAGVFQLFWLTNRVGLT